MEDRAEAEGQKGRRRRGRRGKGEGDSLFQESVSLIAEVCSVNQSEFAHESYGIKDDVKTGKSVAAFNNG